MIATRVFLRSLFMQLKRLRSVDEFKSLLPTEVAVVKWVVVGD